MRSPVAAVAQLVVRTPIPYQSRLNLSIPMRTGNGPLAQMEAITANGTLFAIVDKLAGGVAAPDWHLYRKATTGDPEDRVEVTSHAALDTWNQPNPFYTRQEFVETVQQHHELTGEQWWVVGRSGVTTTPLSLWPVRPDRMEPVPSRDSFLAGYLFNGPDGEQIPLDLDQVVFVRRPNPVNPYRGLSPLAAMLLDLEADQLAREWNRNFFRNSAEPGGIIEMDRRLSDPEWEEMRARWDEQHRGIANAHRVAILEAGRWVDRKYTQRDMEFTTTRELSNEQIRQAFGFPKPMLGAVDEVNRANAEAGEYVFVKHLLVPRLERIKGALNNDFLPLFGPAALDLEFDYDDPVPDNAEMANAKLTTQANAAKALVDAGFDPTGVLEVVGLPEIEHIGLPEPAKQIATTAEEAAPEPGSEPAAPDGRRAPAPEARRRLNATVAPRQDWEERRDTLIDQWKSKVTPAQVDELATQVEQAVKAGKPADLANLTCSTDTAADLLADTMFAQATAAGRRIALKAAAQGVAISPCSPGDPPGTTSNAVPRKLVVVAGLAADLVAGAKAATSFLASSLAVAVGREALRIWSPGAKPEDVVTGVRTYVDDLSDAALSKELGHSIWAAENEGRFATLEQAEKDGKPASYTANETNDANTCDACAEIDGTTFDTLDDAMAAYPFGGYVDCEGGSNCRGTVEPDWG